MSKLFSERNGNVTPKNVIVKETVTREIVNAISTCLSLLKRDLEDADDLLYGSIQNVSYDKLSYYKLGTAYWTEFLNQKYSDIPSGLTLDWTNESIYDHFLNDQNIRWYRKLDCVEFVIAYMEEHFDDVHRRKVKDNFVSEINRHFERLNYGYRIINGKITDIVSKTEIESIKMALAAVDTSASGHLNQALALYSKRPNQDYQNSCKESITAVESICREITGEETLGKSLPKLQNYFPLHQRLQESIQKLYDYSNQKDTGIRHAIVGTDYSNVPGQAEAMLLLVECSAIVNFLTSKRVVPAKA